MQIPPHSHNHPPPPHREQANIHSCKLFLLFMASRGSSSTSHDVSPSLVLFTNLAFPLIVALFQILIFLHAACLSLDFVWVVKESDSDTVIMVIVLVVGVGGIFMLFAVMALCYRSLQNVNMREKFALVLLPKRTFFSSTFLSFISPAAHRHLFLSARQFCRIRPQPISISVHHRAAFLTLLQNFATFLDAFLVVQQLGEFSFPLTETSGGSKE